MTISNLSSNNTAAAIKRYRDNYDRAFATMRISVTVREVPAPPMDDLDDDDDNNARLVTAKRCVEIATSVADDLGAHSNPAWNAAMEVAQRIAEEFRLETTNE